MTCLKCGKETTETTLDRYHYKESGLDSVYINRVVRSIECACGFRLVHIPHIERLNLAIAYDILKKKTLLVGKEFRFLRKWSGLTVNRLAALMGVSRQKIYRAERESQIIPQTDHALRMLVMRLKEEFCKKQMFFQISVEELFENMPKGPSKPAKIVIDANALEYSFINLKNAEKSAPEPDGQEHLPAGV